MGAVAHEVERLPPCRGRLAEATAWEPGGNLGHYDRGECTAIRSLRSLRTRRDNVGEERAGTGADCELLHSLVDGSHERVVLALDVVAVRHHENDLPCAARSTVRTR